MSSQGKIAYGNSLGLQAQIDDLRLKCGILEEDDENRTSGSTPQFPRKISPPCRIKAFQLLLLSQRML